MNLRPNSKVLRIIFDYAMITLGSFILAVGIGIFMLDADIVPGGVTGISMAINYLTGAQVGLMIWILNVPLFIWGILELGKAFGMRTFWGFTTNAFFIDFLRGDVRGFDFIQWQNSDVVRYLLEKDFFFLILVASILTGIGLGMVFKFKGTTAGTEIVSAILKKRLGMKPGIAMVFVDFFIIIGTGAVIQYKGVSEKPIVFLILYALFSLFLSAVILDKIVYGIDYAKNVLIFSNKNPEISDFIIKTLDRSATLFHARGAYKGDDKDVLMTIMSPSEVRELTPYVQSIDPTAFMVLSNVHEVLGEGFRTREDVDIKFLKDVEKKEQAQQLALEAAKNAILAEVVAQKAQEKADEARSQAHALETRNNTTMPNDEQILANQKALLAEETANLALRDAQTARQLANELEEAASAVHEVVEN